MKILAAPPVAILMFLFYALLHNGISLVDMSSHAALPNGCMQSRNLVFFGCQPNVSHKFEPILKVNHCFLREAWALYGIGATVLLLRFATRIKTVGYKGSQGDDYMSILVLALFTMDAAIVHIIYYTGTNVEGVAVQQTRTLTAAEIATYEFGSKEQLAAWYSYAALIWAMKGTMLFFFNRLTIGLWQHRYVKWLGIACVLSYIIVLLTVRNCTIVNNRNIISPDFDRVVPDPGQRCTLKLQNFLVTVVLNVMTDVAILIIPAPLLWRLKIPLKRSNPSALNINRWGIRETIVGIVTINLPILKPLFNKPFWSKYSFKSSSLSRGIPHNLDHRGPYEMSSRLRSKDDNWDAEAGIAQHKSASKSDEGLERVKSLDSESQTYILQGSDLEKGVVVSTTHQVRSESVGRGQNAEGWESRGGASRHTRVRVAHSLLVGLANNHRSPHDPFQRPESITSSRSSIESHSVTQYFIVAFVAYRLHRRGRLYFTLNRVITRFLDLERIKETPNREYGALRDGSAVAFFKTEAPHPAWNTDKWHSLLNILSIALYVYRQAPQQRQTPKLGYEQRCWEWRLGAAISEQGPKGATEPVARQGTKEQQCRATISQYRGRIFKSDEYILKRYRNSRPSLIVHLHPTHFRFDQQEGSFSYKSPMRILIEHLKQRTVPHDLVEFMPDVPFYEGCMIVQIHNHKSIAPSQETGRTKAGAPKTTPFSVHNYNAYLTPSSYVPYPTQNNLSGKGKGADTENEQSGKAKSAEQKDQENMPAPSLPSVAQGSKLAKKPKISTIVLRSTPLSNYVDLSLKASEASSNHDGRRDSRQDGPLSATVPPTPTTGVPPTPSTSMAPPAKRLKKNKVELDASNIHAAESQIALATTAPLVLDPVGSAAESAALLESLAHPMHSEKPPSPKTRKRTVAEMAADEALAAEQERYMLILDERLSSNAVSAQGGGNPADGDGQAGGASFEPRFERFKTLENIKNQHEENKRTEQIRQAEAERKQANERDRETLKLKNEKEQQDKLRAMAAQQQQAAARQDAQRRQQMAAQAQHSQQGLQGLPNQVQGQHGHPQANPAMAPGMQGQPARFHQQQASQAQISSPIVRNGTPQSHSSPIVNNMGNAPMQQSTSSMGGSPPRPGSVVHQNQPQMGAPGSHPMATQRSQQSHAGTPRMPNSTPNIQSTPLNRQMSQTPRMSQASPIQGPMAQAPHMPMMPNGQGLTQAQQQQLQQQRVQQLMRQSQQNQAAAQGMGGMINGQQLSPGQMMQAQMLRQQQGIPMANNAQIAQGYANHMANIAARQGMQPNMNPNFMNPNVQNMQMQNMQLQQLQFQQAQARAQAQAHAQVQAQARQQQQQPQALQSQMQTAIRQQAQHFYRERLPSLQAQHPGGDTTGSGTCVQDAMPGRRSKSSAKHHAVKEAASDGCTAGTNDGWNAAKHEWDAKRHGNVMGFGCFYNTISGVGFGNTRGAEVADGKGGGENAGKDESKEARLSIDYYIVYEPRVFNEYPRDEEVRYFDTVPSDKVNRNWHELFEQELISEVGRQDQGVRLPDGSYMASPMVFQSALSQHCLNSLKQSIECTGDMTLLTMRWEEDSPLPLGNFSSTHECVNWDRMVVRVKPCSVDPFENGVLVHPTLGPEFTDGKFSTEGSDIR
ncbi:hypothetical protein G7Y89_g6523 [Cudoniella acicularis]|uniref:Uncharacterized protein n=1 Tax=Cudoniella acicularis TaxID=354080 RepID=A0A8H4W4N9_9HELO|nr:hypothetical protein G7Y89_g6523 [Cudoniella acicularis]